MLELCGLEEEIFLQVDKNRRLEPPDFVYVVKYINPFSKALDAYPELFAVVGSQVPNLRGLFLRGQGGNSAALDVQQSDAIRNIVGSSPTMTGGGRYDQTSGAISAHVWYWQSANTLGGSGMTYGLNFDASRVVPTANENRLVNQAVRYLIRARP